MKVLKQKTKTMRAFDFFIQTLLFAAVLISTITGRDFPVWLALIQFFMGVWQVISALLNSIIWKSLPRLAQTKLRNYWFGVVVYFAVLGFLYIAFAHNNFLIPGIWFATAWILAIYYYVFTIQLLFPKTKQSTFMDIAN